MMKTDKFKPIVLVVSKEFLPLFFIGYKKAFLLWYNGRADVIEWYPVEDLNIKTINNVYRVPAIIKIHVGYKHIYTSNPSRISIFYRDNWTCAYCGKICSISDATVDHIIPKSKGGEWSWNNLVTSCKRCNYLKKDNIWKPTYVKPRRPELIELQLKKFKNKLHPIIETYLSNFKIYEKIKKAG